MQVASSLNVRNIYVLILILYFLPFKSPYTSVCKSDVCLKSEENIRNLNSCKIT